VARAPAPASRTSVARIEAALDDAADGLTMRELVVATGLHENALRRNLGRLAATGSVHVESERRPSRGRPTLRYRRTSGADVPFRRFLPLLLELLDRAPVSDEAAFEIGRAHGAALPPGPSGDAVDGVARLLVTLGFEPQRRGTSPCGGTVLALTRCPFSEAVTSGARGDRICALHRGLLAGAASANGGELESFTVNDPRLLPCELSVR
jgi:predicted ArsR family transcriptional regulator